MGLGAIISKLSNVQYSGEATNIPQLSLASLLPSTGEYVTYEGSTTYPGWDDVRGSDDTTTVMFQMLGDSDLDHNE